MGRMKGSQEKKGRREGVNERCTEALMKEVVPDTATFAAPSRLWARPFLAVQEVEGGPRAHVGAGSPPPCYPGATGGREDPGLRALTGVAAKRRCSRSHP